MKDKFKRAEKMRNSTLQGNVFFAEDGTEYTNADKCLFNSKSALFTFTYCNILVNPDNNKIIIIDVESAYSIIIPFECEDEHEFFQLSTVYDFKDIKFEDLKQFRDLFYFMLSRYENDKKGI